MKSEVIIIIFIWIFSFVIYGIWNKYINGDNKRNSKKRVRKKGKIKSGNKLPISDIFFQN